MTDSRDAGGPDLDASTDPAVLLAGLEAVLFVADEPVPDLTLAAVLGVTPETVGSLLATLAARYDVAASGIRLRQAAGGWRVYTDAGSAEFVGRFVTDGQSVRLSQAALETLAVIAYQQPVTRARIAAVRGVNVDAVVRTLTNRGLVAEAGTTAESGAVLYTTTELFLERLGLRDLGELPVLADHLPDHTVLDEQLPRDLAPVSLDGSQADVTG